MAYNWQKNLGKAAHVRAFSSEYEVAIWLKGKSYLYLTHEPLHMLLSSVVAAWGYAVLRNAGSRISKVFGMIRENLTETKCMGFQQAIHTFQLSLQHAHRPTTQTFRICSSLDWYVSVSWADWDQPYKVQGSHWLCQRTCSEIQNLASWCDHHHRRISCSRSVLLAKKGGLQMKGCEEGCLDSRFSW